MANPYVVPSCATSDRTMRTDFTNSCRLADGLRASRNDGHQSRLAAASSPRHRTLHERRRLPILGGHAERP